MSPKTLLTYNVCETCGKKYERKASLNRHIKKHTGIKPHKCDNCGNSFARKDYLKVHMLTHSDDKLLEHTEKRKVTKISGCGRNILKTDKGDQSQKSGKYTRSKVKKFPCPRCSRSFSRKDNLNAHMSTHIKTTAFRCANPCTFESYSESEIKEHVITHTDFPAYTMHEVIYKPLKCPQCSMQFSRQGGLVTHMRVHEKVKRFACNLCDYQSSWINRMKLHALSYHIKNNST